MIDSRIVYQLLVGAAMSKTLIDLSAVLSHHYLAPDDPKFNAYRSQVNETLLGLYEMDLSAGRPPLSALFVLRQTKLPGPALRDAIEKSRGAKFQSTEEWKAYWRELITSIYTHYDLPVKE